METNFEDYVIQQAPSLAAKAGPTWFLLMCMDYRYAHRVVDLMDREGLRGKYDVFVLAGAAAGANEEPDWLKVLVTHVKTARELKHHIERIMILEHRDCGAYKKFFGLDWANVKPPEELAEHLREVRRLTPVLKDALRDPEYPELDVVSFLLARDQDDPLETEDHKHS
jgi:carbonic anhydrase